MKYTIDWSSLKYPVNLFKSELLLRIWRCTVSLELTIPHGRLLNS